MADTGAMSDLYKRHRLPPEIIAYAVWLYYRFALSFRDVEEFIGFQRCDRQLQSRTVMAR
jgi:transposase-like protein